MNAAVIAFTLKGQNFQKIEAQLQKLHNELSPNTVLIHGFLPRRVALDKNIPLDVIDALAEYFPIQLNMHDGEKVLRDEMAEVAQRLGAVVYVIGGIKEGVSEEISLYENKGLEIVHLLLNEEAGDTII